MGPLLAGPLLATVGVAGAYGIAVAFMFAGCLGAARVATVSRGGVKSLRGAAGSLRDGWTAVRGNAPVFSIFLVVVAHCSLTMSFDAVLPAMADHHLHRPTHGLAILIVSLGFGAFLGTFALSLFNGARRGPFFLGDGTEIRAASAR
ncbi:MAG: hypothetical protein U5Q44_03640 [Dehalococcoidia bacterium]|nr:hypothetical protein [Dehalococcoidia bacterium]